MSDAILVLNAGSSSLKFGVFGVEGGAPTRLVGGVFEELHGDARFRSWDTDGAAAV